MQRVRISPLARALALKKDIDISLVKGTGPARRILVKDVENFNISSAFAPKTTDDPVSVAYVASSIQPKIISTKLVARREKTTGLRKAIAKQMRRSWENVGYTNLTNEIDVTKMVKIRDQMKDMVFAKTGVKLSYLHFTIKAIAVALLEYQILMTKYDEKTSELVYPGQINMGVAVDTPAGLFVPVIKNILSLSLLDIAKEVSRLAGLARTGKITGKDMQGADFTITSYGSVGSMWGVPVINFPEMAIAGVGAIVPKVYESKEKSGTFFTGKAMNLTVAADHRWVDGATIGRYSNRVKELLENPNILGVY